jgi:hypothetical protein
MRDYLDRILAQNPEIARKQKIKVAEAAALAGVSEDTFRRRYSHLIKQLSPRRQGVSLGDALDIGETV